MCNRKIIIYCTILFFTAIVFLFIGCSSQNVKIDTSKPLPSIIKKYKHVTLRAGKVGMKNTGVFINKGDMYTIMAIGRMNFCPGGNCRMRDVRPEQGWPLIARIGSAGQFFHPLSKDKNSGSTESFLEGRLFIGYKQGRLKLGGEPYYPKYYQDDRGAFSIDIIVWSKNDYIQITDFLKQQVKINPKNKVLQDSLALFNSLKKVQLAELEATQQVEETQKEISQLQQKAADQGKSAVNQQQVMELETRLANLTATLAELEEMKRALGMEKQKTQQLSQQLEEKEKREKQLLDKIASGTKNPPILLITSPADGLKTESKSVRLSGAAKDEQGLKQLNIFVNNRLIDVGGSRGIRIAEGVYPRRLDMDRRIPLAKGTNQIKIHVIDTDGLFTERTLTVHHIEKRRNVWAVVVGINDYPRIRKLKYAVNDAKAFYDLLVQTNQIPPENVFLMVNGQANLKQLRSTLGTRLKNKAGKDDMVIIYFAGHGATERDMMSPDGDGLEKYLLPFDADPNDLYASALPMREIAHIFHRIRSERLIFIADACYSGASGGRTVSISGVRANLSDAFLERIAGGKGKIIITASSANEVSVEKDELRHGVFTYYMVEGLRGRADSNRDGLITVDEAYRYVSDKVTRATGQEQHPVKKGTVEGQLVLGVVQ